MDKGTLCIRGIGKLVEIVTAFCDSLNVNGVSRSRTHRSKEIRRHTVIIGEAVTDKEDVVGLSGIAISDDLYVIGILKTAYVAHALRVIVIADLQTLSANATAIHVLALKATDRANAVIVSMLAFFAAVDASTVGIRMCAGCYVVGICFTASGADTVCKFVGAGCYVIGVLCAASSANALSKLVYALIAAIAAGAEKRHRKNQHRNKQNQL